MIVFWLILISHELVSSVYVPDLPRIPEDPSSYSYTDLNLFHAAQKGEYLWVKEYLKKTSAFASDEKGWDAYTYAKDNGHQYTANYLLQSQLIQACQVDDVKKFSFCLRKGANYNRMDSNGKTPYHYAVEYNSTKVKVLLEDLIIQQVRRAKELSDLQYLSNIYGNEFIIAILELIQ